MARQSNRPSGMVILGWRIWLHTVQNGVCAQCGGTMFLDVPNSHPAQVQVSHVVADTLGGGYVGGNVFGSCQDCNNTSQGSDLTSVVPFFVRPDVMPTTLPGATEALKIREAYVSQYDAVRAAAAARRVAAGQAR